MTHYLVVPPWDIARPSRWSDCRRHFDEVIVTIGGKRFWRWRAVDSKAKCSIV